MQSKTSFFNFTVFKKTCLRFSPIWAAYLFIWILIMPMMSTHWAGYNIAEQVAFRIVDLIPYISVMMSLIFCGMSAMAVFSYMNNLRSSVMMHSLPVSRGGLFASNYIAGLSFTIIPNFLIYGITALIMACDLTVSIAPVITALNIWLGVTCGLCFFFYSFGVLICMLSGSWFVMPILYTILNFTAAVVEPIIRTGLKVFCYGYIPGSDRYLFLSPAPYIITNFRFYHYSAYEGGVREIGAGSGEYRYLIWLIVAAVILTAAAFLLYRKRKVESAGEIMSFAVLRPVFKYTFAAGCALVIGAMISLIGSFSSETGIFICAIVGAVIGYFIAVMAINKSFRINGKILRNLAVFLGVIVVIFLALIFDLFGIETYIPDSGDVQSATVYSSSNGIISTSDGKISVEDIRRLHKAVISQKEENQKDENYRPAGVKRVYVEFTYQKHNGIVKRGYYIPLTKSSFAAPGSAQSILKSIFNNKEYIMQVYSWLYNETPPVMAAISLDAYDDDELQKTQDWKYDYDAYAKITAPDDRIMELVAAAKADIDAGVYETFGSDSIRIGTVVFSYPADIRQPSNDEPMASSDDYSIAVYQGSKLEKLCLEYMAQEVKE